MGRIFSPGKLLLTSEYAVLDGALALAVATKPGQEFFFEEIPDAGHTVIWDAQHQGKPWLSAKIDYQNQRVILCNLADAAEFILKVFINLKSLAPEKFISNHSFKMVTNLQFPADFGLGSSSTLMNNLAEWAGADAFALNDACLGGSGYDIAVAKEKSAILFQVEGGMRKFERIDFRPNFTEELIFIHLNKKQDSRQGIQRYRALPKSAELIAKVSEITKNVIQCSDISEFSSLMEDHEALLSRHLHIPTVKEQHFADCPVFVKSLGAWGGDFVISRKFDGFEQYFRKRNFNNIFTWDDLIL